MNDDTDAKILTMLQDDARISNAEIARRLGMAPSAVLERVRKLEARGAILGYEARINPRAVNAGLLAFIFVRTESICGDLEVGQALAPMFWFRGRTWRFSLAVGRYRNLRRHVNWY